MQRVASTDLPTGPAGPIDFDEIGQGAATNAGARGGEAPQLIAFASLSMPPKALRQLIQDTARAGGVVVFRGFPNNSLKAFSQALGKIVERQDDFANIGIDPRLFRTFDVQARSEEHTSELQSLMRISYDVLCFTKKKQKLQKKMLKHRQEPIQLNRMYATKKRREKVSL